MLDQHYHGTGTARPARRKAPIRRGLRHAFWSIFDAEASLRAAGVAFFAFLSLFPALAACMSLVAIVVPTEQILAALEAMSAALPIEFRQLLDIRIVEQLRQQTDGELGFWIATIIALWSGSRGMDSLLAALAMAEDEPATRDFFPSVLRALLFTLGGFAVFGLLVIAATLAPLIIAFLPQAVQPAVDLLRWPVLFVVLFGAHLALYRYGPQRSRRPRHRFWPGALIATMLWLAGSAVLSVYFHSIARYDLFFGSIAGVAVVMFWLYALTLFTLFGARYNAKA